MAVSIIVGGQFGSEGKGKVAHYLARERFAAVAVRVGGTNSGHTAIDEAGRAEILRQLPTAALLDDVICVLPPGSYVDPALLIAEVERIQLDPERLVIDPRAFVVRRSDALAEKQQHLGERIGSTCSGTGSAVSRRVARRSPEDLACTVPALRPFVRATTPLLRSFVRQGERVIIEGTQGYGLSLLHSPYYPHVTSRDTTAAGALSECGLSPLDVDEVVLVLRSHPIRVAGNSGPFASKEIDWSTVGREGGHGEPIAEYTSVTGRLRRVARFDPGLVRQAIETNSPSAIALNHVDYIDARTVNGVMTERARSFVAQVEEEIDQRVDYIGLGPELLLHAGAAQALPT
jgi:adenylosuccinate synthase